MNKTTKEIYQENQIITESINKIMEEASTDREVLSRLRNLKTSTQTQLARSQICFYYLYSFLTLTNASLSVSSCAAISVCTVGNKCA